MPGWSVSEPQRISFEEPVRRLRVRTVSGKVNVVAGAGPARLEVSRVEGAPLQVELAHGELSVGYADQSWKDFSWKSLSALVDKFRQKRVAVISLVVPPETAVEVGAVSSDNVLSGLAGPVRVGTASGDVTLVGLTGPAEATTVSGAVEAHGGSGDLRTNTVSGSLTVLAGSGGLLRAKGVSGPMTVDLLRPLRGDVELTNVSGDVAVRLPAPADAQVHAETTSGDVSSSFDQLTVGGLWAGRRITGTLGQGTGKLRITTVSGSVAVLRRPEDPEPRPGSDRLAKQGPADGSGDGFDDGEGASA